MPWTCLKKNALSPSLNQPYAAWPSKASNLFSPKNWPFGTNISIRKWRWNGMETRGFSTPLPVRVVERMQSRASRTMGSLSAAMMLKAISSMTSIKGFLAPAHPQPGILLCTICILAMQFLDSPSLNLSLLMKSPMPCSLWIGTPVLVLMDLDPRSTKPSGQK